jgi:hypothetical protein
MLVADLTKILRIGEARPPARAGATDHSRRRSLPQRAWLASWIAASCLLQATALAQDQTQEWEAQRERQWIERKLSHGDRARIAVFLSDDYSEVLFRVRCDPGKELLVEYFAELLPHRQGVPVSIIVDELAEHERSFVMRTTAVRRGERHVLEARIAVTAELTSAILVARDISIDAPNAMGEPWRVGKALAFRKIVETCR